MCHKEQDVLVFGSRRKLYRKSIADQVVWQLLGCLHITWPNLEIFLQCAGNQVASLTFVVLKSVFSICHITKGCIASLLWTHFATKFPLSHHGKSLSDQVRMQKFTYWYQLANATPLLRFFSRTLGRQAHLKQDYCVNVSVLPSNPFKADAQNSLINR